MILSFDMRSTRKPRFTRCFFAAFATIVRGLFLFLLTAGGASLAFAEGWVEVRSPNFVVATDAGQKKGREVALRFEQMRKVFGSLILKDKVNISAPLQILAFKDRKGLNRVAPIWKGKLVELSGLYQGGEDKHFIALDLSAENAWAAVFHEYAHLLLNANYPRTQVWFDEGFAEYYSTIKVEKKEIRIGDPPQGAPELLQRGMMPVEQLFAIAHDSNDYYQSGQRRSLLYAQGWLMVHYLFDLKKLAEASKYFNLTQNHKVPVAQAMKEAFGLTPKEFDKSLYDYFTSSKALIYHIAAPQGIEEVTFEARNLKDYESETMVADMHQHSLDYIQQAAQEFQAITEKNPNYAEAQRGLGQAYLLKGEFYKAGPHFRRAAALGSNDPRVHYYVAFFLYRKIVTQSTPADPEDLVEMNQAINRAITLDPQYADAYNLRSFVLSNSANHPEAIEAMKMAIRLSPRNEMYKSNLANQYLSAGKFDEAIALFEQLTSSANTGIAESAANQLQTARQWKEQPLLQLREQANKNYDAPQWRPKSGSSQEKDLKAIEQQQRGRDTEEPAGPDTRPVKFVKGMLKSIDCSHEPAAVLAVSVGTKTYQLSAKNAAKMLVISSDDDPFSCQWKNRKVAVNYRESGPVSGEVVSVELY